MKFITLYSNLRIRLGWSYLFFATATLLKHGIVILPSLVQSIIDLRWNSQNILTVAKRPSVRKSLNKGLRRLSLRSSLRLGDKKNRDQAGDSSSMIYRRRRVSTKRRKEKRQKNPRYCFNKTQTLKLSLWEEVFPPPYQYVRFMRIPR